MSPIRIPDLSDRSFGLTVERDLAVPASVAFEAWTKRFDLWFAAPGSVIMRLEVGSPFFFETEYKFEEGKAARRHPHYGRFLQLVPDRLVQITWVTGTEGAETVVTVELTTRGRFTHLRLAHEGFASEAARDGHKHAWPIVLEHMEEQLVGTTSRPPSR